MNESERVDKDGDYVISSLWYRKDEKKSLSSKVAIKVEPHTDELPTGEANNETLASLGLLVLAQNTNESTSNKSAMSNTIQGRNKNRRKLIPLQHADVFQRRDILLQIRMTHSYLHRIKREIFSWDVCLHWCKAGTTTGMYILSR